jgi:DNA polymerase epsilon subunit 1
MSARAEFSHPVLSVLQKNHLSGLQLRYLKISFNTVQELMSVKSEVLPLVERNQAKLDAAQAYESLFNNTV